MSRKDFEAIAAITSRISNDSTRAMVACDQADYFASVNSKFDRERFMKACGF